jgi:hypothetical protein
MPKSRRIAALVFALGLALTGFMVAGAQADPHCDGDVGSLLVFTRYGATLPPGQPVGSAIGNTSYSTKSLGCEVGEEPNTNYLYPGATQLAVRFAQDLKVKTLAGTLDGLGFKNKPITLTRGLPPQNVVGTAQETALGPSTLYDMPWLDIDPTKTGTLKVTVNLPDGPVSDTWRSVGS